MTQTTLRSFAPIHCKFNLHPEGEQTTMRNRTFFTPRLPLPFLSFSFSSPRPPLLYPVHTTGALFCILMVD